MPTDDQQLLADQQAFYRAQAPDYDDWWQRRRAYDHRGPVQTEDWYRQVATVEQALAAFGPTGDVLEAEGWKPALEATRWFLYGSARPRSRM